MALGGTLLSAAAATGGGSSPYWASFVGFAGTLPVGFFSSFGSVGEGPAPYVAYIHAQRNSIDGEAEQLHADGGGDNLPPRPAERQTRTNKMSCCCAAVERQRTT